MMKSLNFEDIARTVMSTDNTTGVSAEKRIREKFLELLNVFDLDRNLFKDQQSLLEKNEDQVKYAFPLESKDFLIELLCSYTNQHVQEMRRGNFSAVDPDLIERNILGFSTMLRSIGHSERVVQQQVSKMYTRTLFPFWKAQRETLSILSSMMEDLRRPSKEELQAISSLHEEGKIREAALMPRTFHYFNIFDGLFLNDQLAFMQMMRDDYLDLQKKHQGIYYHLCEIRQETISSIIDDEVDNLTVAEDNAIVLETNYLMILQDYLDRNEEYFKAEKQRNELIKSNKFIKEKAKRLDELYNQLKQVREQAQIDLFGEIVIHPEKDSNMDLSRFKNTQAALQEAIKSYEEEITSLQEYREKMNKITPEQDEEIRKIINQISNSHNSPIK